MTRATCPDPAPIPIGLLVERLRWLPERATNGDFWDDGWNRCLEYIEDYRAGIEPGDGDHD